MRRPPATRGELYRIANALGDIDAELVKSAADEIERLREKVRFAVEWANGIPIAQRGGLALSVDDRRAFLNAMQPEE